MLLCRMQGAFFSANATKHSESTPDPMHTIRSKSYCKQLYMHTDRVADLQKKRPAPVAVIRYLRG